MIAKTERGKQQHQRPDPKVVLARGLFGCKLTEAVPPEGGTIAPPFHSPKAA